MPRVWRRGNRGNVASALIEKPACGDFLPILDGGYALQYTSLVEHRAGKGMVLFCQTDVSGRTETDPAAETLARNILRIRCGLEAEPHADGGLRGRTRRANCILPPRACGHGIYGGGKLSAEPGPGGGAGRRRSSSLPTRRTSPVGSRRAATCWRWDSMRRRRMRSCPMKVSTVKREHIAACFEPFGAGSPLAGVSPAEVHNRDPRESSPGLGGRDGGRRWRAGHGGQRQCRLLPACSLAVRLLRREDECQTDLPARLPACVARLLGNMQAAGETRLLEHISTPVAENEKRWLDGLYLDTPEEWDDPYRFFRW